MALSTIHHTNSSIYHVNAITRPWRHHYQAVETSLPSRGDIVTKPWRHIYHRLVIKVSVSVPKKIT
ncbi:MAG: hypothetical protein LKK21_01745 [Prevotella sp.]|nr:hypothetical protein [Prevotella sp.]MCH4017459.1 hypothetical protein [Prevotella sp.]MCI1449741.1 hypothetical protein [Prevotella sp.]MCI2086814.1 hypothetical protein [Prevotella sp.]MCI2124362.1 hypothetical protein [Prevotella sp.]